MKSRFIFILLIFGLFTSLYGQNENIYIYHQAVQGETFKSLEKIYGVSQDAIRDANPNLQWTLKEGESVRIPYQKELITSNVSTDYSVSISNSDSIYYEVKPQETLYGISRKFNISIDQLIATNPVLKDGLKAGQKIIISKEPVVNQKQELIQTVSKEDTSGKHTVKAGETMYSIAKSYRVRLDSLQLANPEIIDNQISIGTVLNIPRYNNINNYIEYTTEEKEKISEIAFNYQVPIQELKDANPEFSKVVPEGKTVKIPVAKYDESMKVDQNDNAQKSEQTETESDNGITELIDQSCIGHWNTEAVFKIALMMPFQSDQFMANRNETLLNSAADYPVFNYFQFYQSVILALENLTEKGLHFELYVYDVTMNDSKLDEVLQDEKLKGMDLIIGFLYKDPFSKVADFAKSNGIVLINVNSTRDQLVENKQNVVKVMPSSQGFSKAVASVLPDTLYSFNLLFFRQKDSLFLDKEQDIRDAIAQKYEIENFSDSTVFSKADLIKKLKKNQPNYIILLSKSKAYIMDVLRLLDKQKKEYDIHIIGYPSWDEMTDLDIDHLQNLNTIFITPYLVDYKDANIVHFIHKFREKYNSEPEQFGYQGYDITSFFVEGLAKFGKDFLPCLNAVEYQPMTTQYQFENSPNNGYINNYWNVYKIHDYEFIRLHH